MREPGLPSQPGLPADCARSPPTPTQLRYKGWLDGEKQVYSPSNALTVGGQLRLRATQSPAGIVSGRVRSSQSWMPSPIAGQYNVIRFEARYRVQPGEAGQQQGTWFNRKLGGRARAAHAGASRGCATCWHCSPLTALECLTC